MTQKNNYFPLILQSVNNYLDKGKAENEKSHFLFGCIRVVRKLTTDGRPIKMGKSIIVIILATAGLLSCKQGSKSTPETVEIKTINSERKYEYTDAMGKYLIIENGGPKGEGYTDRTGKEYFKTIFWTRITNETDSPLELKIEFPLDSYELPSSPGSHFKVLLPSDTMTLDNLKGHNYGLTDLGSFLDNNIQTSATLRRTIPSKESSGFYVVILFDKGVGGPFRTGLSIKAQNLVYRVLRYSGTANSLTDKKEINCGSINLKNLVLQK